MSEVKNQKYKFSKVNDEQQENINSHLGKQTHSYSVKCMINKNYRG